MTAPSAPIDADLSPYSNDVYYVLEDDGIWKTENLTTAGAATWEQVWSSSDFSGSEFGSLMRVRCAPGQDGLVYAIGWGYDSGTPKVFCLKSQNAGGTWSQHWVAEIDDPGEGSIELIQTYVGSSSGYGSAISGSVIEGQITLSPSMLCAASADPNACCKQFFSALVSLHVKFYPPLPEGGGYYPTIEFDVSGGFPSQGYDSDGDAYPWVGGWGIGTVGFRQSTYADVYGSPLTTHASGTLDHRYIRDRFAIGWGFGKPARWEEYACGQETPCAGCEGAVTAGGYVDNIVIDGVSYDGDYPSKGFDVARTNGNWLYVGLQDKIMKSENGGNDWSELTTDHGAHDICVDPQAAGAIYYWDTSGNLRLRVNGVDQGSLLSGSALPDFGRIARDLNSGKLWAIDSSGNLQKRESGAWTVQKSDLVGGRALRAYLGGKVVCADALDIYLSTDYGANWSAKKGGWSGYANPRTVHLMKESS